AAKAEQMVVAVQALDDVVVGGPGQRVGAGRPGDRRVGVRREQAQLDVVELRAAAAVDPGGGDRARGKTGQDRAELVGSGDLVDLEGGADLLACGGEDLRPHEQAVAID